MMDPDGLAASWLSRLQESGYRLTGPRRAIVEILARSPRALGPIDLYDLGRKQYPGLGLVTVYRTLEKLETLGLIQRVHQSNGCNMVLRASHGHQHLLLCTACGSAEYFSGDDLSALTQIIASRSGFQVQDHWLQMFGVCRQCQESEATG